MTGTSCRQQRLIQGELKFIYRESTVLVAVFRGQADLFMETPEKIFEPRYRETVELPPSRLIINHKLSKVLLRPGSLKIAWLYLCSTSILFIFYFEKVDWARLQQLEGVQLRLFYYKDIPILTESHTTLVPRLVPHSIILPPSWIVLIASGRFNSALDYQREASSQSVPILDSHQASLFPSVSVVRDCLELKECNQKI